MLIKNVSASRSSSTLTIRRSVLQGCCACSRPDASPQIAPQCDPPSHTSPPRHRVSIEFAEIPRVPRLVPDSAARRVRTDGGDQGEDDREGLSGAVRAPTGGWMRREVPPGVHSSGVLPEPVHPPAGKAYTHRAIACSPICWTEQQRPPPPHLGSHRCRYFRGVRGAHSPASCIKTRMRRNTCMRARLHTRAHSARSRAEKRSKRRMKVNRKQESWHYAMARADDIERETAPPAHDRGQCRGRGVPNNHLPGIDQPKRLLIQLGAPPCLQIAPHVARRSKVTERRKGVRADQGIAYITP